MLKVIQFFNILTHCDFITILSISQAFFKKTSLSLKKHLKFDVFYTTLHILCNTLCDEKKMV